MKINIQMPRRTPPQKRFDESTSRFNLSVWGRQSGKSTAGYRKMIWKPLQINHPGIYWHVLQTYSAADIIFERYMREIYPHKGTIWNYSSETERRIELIGGRHVFFKSGDNFEDLRAESLSGCIIDEARQQHPDLWRLVIRPMLAKAHSINPQLGWADMLTTPNGFDWVYDIYNDALLNPSEWGVIHAPSTEAWWWTPEEIDSAKKSMGEAEFAQEIMAEFRDLTTGKAYVNWSEANMLTENPFFKGRLIHPGLPICVFMDFNLSPMAWTLAQKKIDDFYCFDEVWLTRSHTQEAAEVLAQKIIAYGHQKLGVILVGDATSKSGQRAAAGQSDYDIVCQVLDKYEIRWVNMTPESNPNVKDRVNTVNAKLKDGNGISHLWIHPTNCPQLRRDFERVVWKASSGSLILDQTTDKERTHSSDGVGYGICELSPLVYKKGGTRMSIINAPGLNY